MRSLIRLTMMMCLLSACGGGGGGDDDANGAPDTGASCGALQASCSSAAECCDDLACPGSGGGFGYCCALAGGSCTEDYDCCFGTCAAGTCGCSSPSFGEGCLTDGECCAESPDHVACVEDPPGAAYGSCAFTGDITLTTQSCVAIGMSGIDITEYCVTLSGTFTGPVGATSFLYSDPSITENTPCGPAEGCNAWTYDGVCTRGALEPDATEFSFSYVFGSDVPVSVMPQLNLDGPNGGLDSVYPTIVCP